MINTYEGHQFCSESRAYTKISRAFCECGVEYDWAEREGQHDRHVFAMIWEDGWCKGVMDEVHHRLTPNPYGAVTTGIQVPRKSDYVLVAAAGAGA